MSDSLPLSDHLLARARLMARIGHLADARRLFRRVLGQPELPNHVRAEVFQAMAEMAMDAGHFRRARRLLFAAIRLRRHADELYVEYARAVTADPDADPRLAVKALRRAVGIDPFEARSWTALGTAALRAGEHALARKALRRAARLRPDQAETLLEIADGLLELGREDEARAVLTAARFQSPNDAGVKGVWDRFRFALALRQQRRLGVEDAAILPFPAPTRESSHSPAEAVVLRADRKSVSTPHLLRLFGRRSDPRQAQ
jgi:tetratricopeptide (TPR) repeat protein